MNTVISGIVFLISMACFFVAVCQGDGSYFFFMVSAAIAMFVALANVKKDFH